MREHGRTPLTPRLEARGRVVEAGTSPFKGTEKGQRPAAITSDGGTHIPQSGPPINHVPVSIIAPLIRNWLAVYSANRGPNESIGSENEGHLATLSFHCGVSGRTLRRIITNTVLAGSHRHGTQKHTDQISFDMADKIVCATLGPLAWHTDETLKPHYGPLEVTAGELREGRELPEGFDFKGLPAEKQRGWMKARREELAA